MASGGDVGQHDAARAADAAAAFVVDIDLGTERSEHDEPRNARTLFVLDVFGCDFEFGDPFGNRVWPVVRVDLKRVHYYTIDIRRHVRPDRGKRRRFMHNFLHNELHHVARERRFAAEHQIRDGAESVEVRTFVDAHFGLHLLGRHKLRRADDAA